MLIRAAQYLLIFNLFLLPYERAMVYTGDRLALAAIGGELASAISAMQKLFVGRQLGYSLNPEGIIDQQRQLKGSFFAFLARIKSGFPMMTTRYVDLISFAKAYFPAQYAHFVAANPGLSEDVHALAAISEPAKAVLDANTPVKSGLAAGWATSAATLAGLCALVLIGWPRTPNYDEMYSEYPSAPESFVPGADGSAAEAADAGYASDAPVDPYATPTDASTEAAEPAPVPANTPVDFDPDRPIVFDNFYPEASKRRGEQGRCVVQITVKADGSITDPVLASSTGYPLLDEACIESLNGQYLLAATEGGVPIEQTVFMPIDWTLTAQ
jgi:TonB family protein